MRGKRKLADKAWHDLATRDKILVATAFYIAFVAALFWWATNSIGFFNETTMQIASWEDRRSFGLGFAGLLAPWLAIIGYILSAARTKAVEDANRQQVDDHRQRLYMDALQTLNRKKDYQKAGAIESLRKLGRQEDGEYRTQVIEILTAFIRSTARIADRKIQSPYFKRNEKKTGRRLNPSGTALNLASALHALSEIQSTMEFPKNIFSFDEHAVVFDDLDLSELDFMPKKSISRMYFSKCDFSGCKFMRVKFIDTNFWSCNFNKANLSDAHFAPRPGGLGIALLKSTFEDTYMHRTDFENVGGIDEGQLLRVRYSERDPPKNVPETTGSQAAGILPTPFIPDDADSSKGHYMSVGETKQRHALGNHEKGTGPFRPLHKDGRPVPIIHPDDPDDVILD